MVFMTLYLCLTEMRTVAKGVDKKIVLEKSLKYLVASIPRPLYVRGLISWDV